MGNYSSHGYPILGFDILIQFEIHQPSTAPSDADRKQKKLFSRMFLVQYCLNLKNIARLETRISII